MKYKDKRTPDYILEKIALGEMEQGHLSNEDLLRLEQIKKSNSDILSKYPPDINAKKIMNKYIEQKGHGIFEFLKNTFRLPRVKYSFAAVLALVFVVIAYPLIIRDDTNTIKGAVPRLAIYKKGQKGTIERLQDLSVVSSGDILQLSILYSKNMYAAVASIDGRNNITYHIPANSNDSPVLVKQSSELIIPSAYELDDTPGFEKFILISSAKQFNLKEVLTKLDAYIKDKKETDGINIDMITLKK